MYKYISWVAVILWMMVIFYLSHQPATESSELSMGVTEVIVVTVEKVVPSDQFDMSNFHHIVRKNAHFFVYMVLGVLLFFALGVRRSGIRTMVIAILICVLNAISDEVHQLFVPGRGAQVKDVFIDSAGAIVGVGAGWLIGRVVGRVH